MATLTSASGSLRVTNEGKRSIFSVSGVSPNVSADTVAEFVSAVEKLHNDGSCDARISIVLNLQR